MSVTPVTISGLPTLTIGPPGSGALGTANSIDAVNDYLAIYQNSSTSTLGINRNTLLNLSSQPVGLTDTQTLTNKTLTSPTISSPTFSGTTAGTFTLGGTITFPSSVVTLTGTQTLTNKTLTSPTINAPTITNASITADAVTGFTTSNSGTIYGGITVTTGNVSLGGTLGITGATTLSSTLAVTGASTFTGAVTLPAQTVTPSKLNLAPTTNNVATTGTTASTSYTPTLTSSSASTCTVTIGANGLLLVGVAAQMSNSTTDDCFLGFALSGANTVAAAAKWSIMYQSFAGGAGAVQSGVFLLTGLTAGSTTITANFLVTGGTGTYANNQVWGLPL